MEGWLNGRRGLAQRLKSSKGMQTALNQNNALIRFRGQKEREPMPYASRAQQGLFHSPNSPVSPSVVKEFDQASKGQKNLPYKVKKKLGAKMQRAYSEGRISNKAMAKAGY